jgi:maltokinase
MRRASELDERELIEYVTAQRWFGSKGREVMAARVVDAAELPALLLALVELRFREGTHEVYQLLVSRSGTGEAGTSAPGRAPSSLRTRDELDGLAVPALARELVHLVRSGKPQPAGDGTIEFHQVEGFAGLGRELGTARSIESEQSNSSVVFDEELILKVYRRLEPGINPELEMLRFLTERGFANAPALGGWHSYIGRPLEATLGIVQEFVPGGLDGWELALDELAEAPDRFLGRLPRLGRVTGEMHSVLASEPADPTFSPEQPSLESLGLLTASVDEEIARVFLELPEEVESLAPILGRGEEVRERLRMLTHAGTTGRIIRHHGDFHLGQTLWAADDWIVLDFEGEPARSLPERRRKRSPLRDVAGMLRSFAYAASAVEMLRGATAPPGWEERARAEFLDAYLEVVDQTIVPAGREAFDKLLSVFELEKAVYELRYELNARPDWLPIPVAGIVRMLEQPVAT